MPRFKEVQVKGKTVKLKYCFTVSTKKHSNIFKKKSFFKNFHSSVNYTVRHAPRIVVSVITVWRNSIIIVHGWLIVLANETIDFFICFSSRYRFIRYSFCRVMWLIWCFCHMMVISLTRSRKHLLPLSRQLFVFLVCGQYFAYVVIIHIWFQVKFRLTKT